MDLICHWSSSPELPTSSRDHWCTVKVKSQQGEALVVSKNAVHKLYGAACTKRQSRPREEGKTQSARPILRNGSQASLSHVYPTSLSQCTTNARLPLVYTKITARSAVKLREHCLRKRKKCPLPPSSKEVTRRFLCHALLLTSLTLEAYVLHPSPTLLTFI